MDTVGTYQSATRTLAAELKARGIIPPKFDTLHDKVLFYFENKDIEFVRKVTHPSDENFFEVRSYYEETVNGATSSGSLISFADSIEDAICSVLGRIDKERAQISKVEQVPSGIVIYADGKPYASFGRIPFKTVDDAGLKRCERLLDGLVAHQDTEKFCARLRTLPGLQSLQSWMRPGEPSIYDGSPMFPSMKNTVISMGRLLESIGIEVSRSVLLEITAKTFWAPDWNTFKAMADREIVVGNPMIILGHEPSSMIPCQGAIYYRTLSSALWGLNQHLTQLAAEREIFPYLKDISTYTGVGVSLEVYPGPMSEPDYLSNIQNPQPLMELSHPEITYGSDGYLPLVKKMMAAGEQNLAQSLANELGVDAPAQVKHARTSHRIGSHHLRLGNWLFSRPKSWNAENPDESYFLIERFSDDFSERLWGAFRLSEYKTEILRTGEKLDQFCIVYDYMNKFVTMLDGLTEDDVATLLNFMGPHRCHYYPDRVLYYPGKMDFKTFGGILPDDAPAGKASGVSRAP